MTWTFLFFVLSFTLRMLLQVATISYTQRGCPRLPSFREAAKQVPEMVNWRRKQSGHSLKRWLIRRPWMASRRNEHLCALKTLCQAVRLLTRKLLIESRKIVLFFVFNMLREVLPEFIQSGFKGLLLDFKVLDFIEMLLDLSCAK
jgi:hypothetical protein